MKFKIFIFLLTAFLVFARGLFAQEGSTPEKGSRKITVIDASGLSDVLSRSFKTAIETADEEKALEKAKRDEEAKRQLNALIDGWIKAQQAKREGEMNTVIEQDWEDILTTAPRYVTYYLRDFSYTVQDKDIIDTNSIISPYEATIVIKELLYVEQAPLMAEPRSKYQFIADTDITMSLAYDKETARWQIMNTNNRMLDLRKGWPKEITAKVGTYFVPVE